MPQTAVDFDGRLGVPIAPAAAAGLQHTPVLAFQLLHSADNDQLGVLLAPVAAVPLLPATAVAIELEHLPASTPQFLHSADDGQLEALAMADSSLRSIASTSQLLYEAIHRSNRCSPAPALVVHLLCPPAPTPQSLPAAGLHTTTCLVMGQLVTAE